MIRTLTRMLLSFTALAAGCTNPPTVAADSSGEEAPRPVAGLSSAAATGQPESGLEAPTSVSVADAQDAAVADSRLTVDEAVQLALAHSPRAAAARERAAAERARAGGAGAFPEPVLSAGVEALPFDSPREEEEWLVGLSLELPTPGERDAERDVARARGATADAALRRTLLDVDGEARAAFAEAFFAEAALTLAGYRSELTEEGVAIVEAEVEAGTAAPLDLFDVREQQLRARFALDAARRTAQTARARLDLLLPAAGHGRPLDGDVEAALALPELDALLARMDSLPQLAEAAADARLAELRAELAAARRIPRVELALAWRERADGRAALDAGFGIALPFGGRRAAEADAALRDAAAAGALARARWREVRGEVLAAHAEARSAREELRGLQESLLPLAEQRVERAKSLVEVGDASYQEVMEARLQELDLAAEALAASLRMHAAWARLQPLLVADA